MHSPPRWLATLIQLRRQHRDECRRQLDEADRAAEFLRTKLSELNHQLVQSTELRRRAGNSGACNVNMLLAAQRHLAALQLERQSISEQSEQVDRESERRRSALMAAEQQVRMLEKLSERKQADSRGAVQKQEAKLLDELACARFKRFLS